MPAYPQFTATPVLGIGQITTDDAIRDGAPAASATLKTAGVNGTRIDRVVAMAADTEGTAVPVTVIKLWLVLDSGPTWRLFDEFVLNAASATPSDAAAGPRAEQAYTDLVIPTGYSLRVSAASSTMRKVNIMALGGDY